MLRVVFERFHARLLRAGSSGFESLEREIIWSVRPMDAFEGRCSILWMAANDVALDSHLKG